MITLTTLYFFVHVCRVPQIMDFLTLFRKAEHGMTLIKNMSQINTRPSLVDFMSEKTDEVLRKFVSEIGIIETIFLVQNFKFSLKNIALKLTKYSTTAAIL